MSIAALAALSRPPVGGRGGAFLAVVLLGLIGPGCAHERHEITPTTLGTDLRHLPRGKMISPPWPGQSIVESKPRPGPSTADPDAALASGGLPPAYLNSRP
jgi:hypothetical protein